MKFNERIKLLREEQKLTQQDMASILDISKSTYVKYERGEREPRYGTLVALAQYFDVSIDFILGNSNEQNPHLKDIGELIELLKSDEYKSNLGGDVRNAQKLISDLLRAAYLSNYESVPMLDMLYVLAMVEDLMMDLYHSGLHIFNYKEWAEKDSEYQGLIPEPNSDDVSAFLQKSNELRRIIDMYLAQLASQKYYKDDKLYFYDEISRYASVDKEALKEAFRLDPRYKQD